ncbi:MAG: hypothetical protein WC438_05550 [Candidatus Pacearchaeota archaeon]
MNLIKDVRKINEIFLKKAKEVGNTLELVNVYFSFDEDYIKTFVAPVSKIDKGERTWLYKEVNNAISILKKDKNTRKAIFYNLHKSDLEHNCLSLFHLYFRNDLLNMNVYVRSMNFDVNFEQDMYTFDIILNKASKKLKLKRGLINVYIMSLHKYKHEILAEVKKVKIEKGVLKASIEIKKGKVRKIKRLMNF